MRNNRPVDYFVKPRVHYREQNARGSGRHGFEGHASAQALQPCGTPIHGSVPSSFVTMMCTHLARWCMAREQAFPIHRRKHGPGAPYEQDALSVARTVPPALALSPAEPPRSIMDLMIIRRPRCGHHRPETARHDVNLALISGLSFCVGCPGNKAVLEHCPHNGRYLYNALCGHHRHAHRLSNPCIGGSQKHRCATYLLYTHPVLARCR